MPGQVIIELPDGSRYETEYPQIQVEGLMSTEKIMNAIGQLKLRSLTENHELVVSFDAESDRRSGFFGSLMSRGPRETSTGGLEGRKDLLKIEIFKITGEEERECVATA